jgi:hypothetical protein
MGYFPTMRATLLGTLLAGGCFFSAPAPPHRRDAATISLIDSAIAATPDPTPAPISEKSVEPERPWDGCSQYDPSPWPWRDHDVWGETSGTAPSWGYEQERRAPKMPDADRHLRSIGGSKVRAIEDGLLICEVELFTHDGTTPTWYRYKLGNPPARPQCGSDWDTFAPPDALLRFRFRDDYPVALFGPEDHWGFFISIPRVTLRAGDPIAVKIWDRDGGSTVTSANPESKRNEYMGQGKLTFDGRLPFRIQSDFFRMRCNMLPSAAAHARAKPSIDRLERALKAAESWRPSPDRWAWGENTSAAAITSDYGSENFRYAAGFVGWDDDAIKSRVPRAEAIPEADDKKKDQLTASLVAKSPVPTGTKTLPGNRGAMKILSTPCDEHGCAIEIEVDPRAAKDLCQSWLLTDGLQLASVDELSHFGAIKMERRDGDKWVECKDAKLTARTRLRGEIPAGSKLLWLGGIGHALIFRAPEPKNP